MKFEQRIWAKALLSSYAYLENICGSIDKKVISYGIGSASSRDTEFVADKIISLIERKKFLINTKIMLDRALYNIPSDYARVLILKYVDKIKVETAAKVMNVSLRTYFRKVDVGVDKFASQLLSFGYNEKKLYETFSKESWIMDIYKSYYEKFLADYIEVNNNKKIVKNTQNQVKNNVFNDNFEKSVSSGINTLSAFQC